MLQQCNHQSNKVTNNKHRKYSSDILPNVDQTQGLVSVATNVVSGQTSRDVWPQAAASESISPQAETDTERRVSYCTKTPYWGMLLKTTLDETISGENTDIVFILIRQWFLFSPFGQTCVTCEFRGCIQLVFIKIEMSEDLKSSCARLLTG